MDIGVVSLCVEPTEALGLGPRFSFYRTYGPIRADGLGPLLPTSGAERRDCFVADGAAGVARLIRSV